ncbi:MAG: D-tyrosyl-tRNA(Tyr) deacylase [Deltaproteobacteria bacterium]|nr:D-tyrosyl-tRNA(Tyr) deacylase [Myxococcales bacterium]TDJ14740.1 MAG: D-tyrosyl-tRNA(Tyr) deacylase [Deltaproteobacteria bacterium]TDJ21379.1 MAG: D-tyrosyl-tRNA(Tyr) deacylase [Deltaproteobacteria bacterium]
MRAVVQRVSSARVRVGGELVGEMGKGLLALVGVGRDDAAPAAAELARKLVHLRLFQDDDDRMNLSLLDTGGTLGVVSQFTLFGDARGGRRPSYLAAAPAEQAALLLETLVVAARDLGVTVITGRFQSMMQVELVNEGPVTLLLDTDKQF